jgi:hypothetical protein
MYSVSVAEARPGLILAKAVAGPGGSVLCPVGFRLTASAIARLASAGVASVIVQGEREDTRGLETRIASLESRFEGIRDPNMLQLKTRVEGFLKALLQARGDAE